MQQYLKIGLLSLELFTSQKKNTFFSNKKKHQNIGSPERISQRKLPGSIHWALSATTTCRNTQPFEGGVGRKIPRTPTWDDWLLKMFTALIKVQGRALIASKISVFCSEKLIELGSKMFPLCAVNINYNRHICVSLQWCLTWVCIL